MIKFILILGIITIWLTAIHSLFFKETRLQNTKLDSILFTIITALVIADAFIIPIDIFK